MLEFFYLNLFSSLNIPVVAVIAIVAVTLIIFLIWKNKKDRKTLNPDEEDIMEETITDKERRKEKN